MSKIIYHISDWHTEETGMNRQLMYELHGVAEHLRQPDLIVFTGDMVHNSRMCRFDWNGEGQWQKAFWAYMMYEAERWWPTTDKVAVRGNHDFFELDHPALLKVFRDGETDLVAGFKMSGFRGMPPFMGSWNDEMPEYPGLSRPCLNDFAQKIPADTEILLTHCPPHGILDDARDAKCLICGGNVNEHGVCIQGHLEGPTVQPRHIGSLAIRELVDRMPNLKAHFFGHVHESGGRVEVRGNTIFSNAACGLNVVVIP